MSAHVFSGFEIGGIGQRSVDLARITGTSLAYTAPMFDPGDEFVDVVDDQDRVVATVPRREVRERGLLHRCTYVLVSNPDGLINVHRRTESKDTFPGAYDMLPGGVCAAGETYDECARRELAEELGIEGAELEFLFLHRYEGRDGRALGAVYGVTWDGPIRNQGSEVAWSAWVTPNELDRMLAEREFCADSREIFERLRRDRLRP
jgi:ADP-ribose pyrophosphatase YjhB (NUDIX family)